MVVGCWSVQFLDRDVSEFNISHFSEHLASISQVLIFLLGANAIRVSSKKMCLWVGEYVTTIPLIVLPASREMVD